MLKFLKVLVALNPYPQVIIFLIVAPVDVFNQVLPLFVGHHYHVLVDAL